MEKIKLTLNINNKPCEVIVMPNDTLLEVLRDQLDLTDQKKAAMRVPAVPGFTWTENRFVPA